MGLAGLSLDAGSPLEGRIKSSNASADKAWFAVALGVGAYGTQAIDLVGDGASDSGGKLGDLRLKLCNTNSSETVGAVNDDGSANLNASHCGNATLSRASLSLTHSSFAGRWRSSSPADKMKTMPIATA